MTSLIAKLNNKTALIGIIGLGYVGLPLLLRYVEAGYRVLGFETDHEGVEDLPQRRHHLDSRRDRTHNFLNAVSRVGLAL